MAEARRQWPLLLCGNSAGGRSGGPWSHHAAARFVTAAVTVAHQLVAACSWPCSPRTWSSSRRALPAARRSRRVRSGALSWLVRDLPHVQPRVRRWFPHAKGSSFRLGWRWPSPRLILCLLATTLGGMALTEGWPLSSPRLVCTLGGGALAAAAAGVLNCLWEQDLDGRMQRTSGGLCRRVVCRRPVPSSAPSPARLLQPCCW